MPKKTVSKKYPANKPKSKARPVIFKGGRLIKGDIRKLTKVEKAEYNRQYKEQIRKKKKK